ncbi:MAG TPA: 4-hydroxy-tetrahydrodipicolinate reductase [Acidimicrobiales bacterium]|jgi:4-hydroxy-tetrahydrodipicolinate reductase
MSEGPQTRVGVFGATGRMGRTVCEAVAAAEGMTLSAAVDPHHEGHDLLSAVGVASDVMITGDRAGLRAEDVDVMVDFTEAAVARDDLLWCAANGVHAVIGTSGLGQDDLETAREAFTRSNCIVVPNFAIGAVLMIRLAELAAPWFDSVEVIELHHDEKVDAPSGTAIHTVERLAAASPTWTPDPTTRETVPGARGATGAGGIAVHSVRLRGLFAHQEVLFGTTGQSLSIRHDAYDRSSMMPGVLLAIREIADRPGLTVGLESLLGLDG